MGFDSEDDDELALPAIDLYEHGGRVLSITRGGRTVVVLPKKVAEHLFPAGLAESGLTDVIDGVNADLEKIAERDKKLATGGLAGSARVIAYELANPFRGGYDKAALAGRLREALDRLLELVPPEEKKGALHAIRGGRSDRLSEGATGT